MPVYLSAFRQSYPEVPGAVAEIVPAPVLSSAGSLVTTIYPVDRDGIVRSMPSGDDFSFGRVPHVSAALDRSSDDEVGRFIDMAIDRRAMPRIPFVDALSEDGLAAAVAGKTVFVGATAVELGDEFAIPVHGLQLGVVLNSIAYESLRRGTEKRRAPLWVTTLIAACVCAFTTLRIGRGSAVLYALAQGTLLIAVMIIGLVLQLAADVSVILAPIYLCHIGAAARHS